jgi:hypothetical protein
MEYNNVPRDTADKGRYLLRQAFRDPVSGGTGHPKVTVRIE